MLDAFLIRFNIGSIRRNPRLGSVRKEKRRYRVLVGNASLHSTHLPVSIGTQLRGLSFRRTAPTIPRRPVPNNNMLAGSGTSGVSPGVPTSLPPLLPSSGTFWKRTKIALQISSSVIPAKAAPLTVNEALSPGSSPRFTCPPEKLLPVIKAKSSTTGGGLPNPCGTVPSSPSLKVKSDERLGA